MLDRYRKIYGQFPRTYWVVVGTHFIDVIGNTLLNPFFALYVTQKFNVGMTQAGFILATNSVAGMVGSTIGGVLCVAAMFAFYYLHIRLGRNVRFQPAPAR